MAGFDVAVLGDGAGMPPVREGGVRTVVLPPALAYGPRGDGCLYGLDGSCRIPPDSEASRVSYCTAGVLRAARCVLRSRPPRRRRAETF
jgi:hypothetical protein